MFHPFLKRTTVGDLELELRAVSLEEMWFYSV